MSETETTSSGGIPMGDFRYLPIAQLRESPTNPRKSWGHRGDMKELEASIREKGVLSPVLVRPWSGNGKVGPAAYELVFGHRRVRAAQAAGLEEVPAIVRDLDDRAVLEAQVVENCQRADLHPLEEAEGYRQLMSPSVGYDVTRVAERVGRSVAYVYDRVRLLSLTKEAQRLFREGLISAGHAVILARLKPADQARAIGKPGQGPLLKHDATLFDPFEKKRERDTFKPVSVRELQRWVNDHVRFDASEPEPMLFPETAAAVKEAQEAELKIVPITHDHFVRPEAKDGKTRTYGPQSWKRADTKRKGRFAACNHAVQGVVVVGPGRGQAFPVCIDKKRCSVHWGKEQRAAKKAKASAAKTGRTGEDRWKIEQERQRREATRREDERKRWQKAVPRIQEAIAAAVLAAPAGAQGLLADEILEVLDYEFGEERRVAEKHVPRGSSAEDLVRHVAFLALASEMRLYTAFEDFPKRAKAFGVDAKKILDEVAPEEAPRAAVAQRKKRAKKTAARKAAKRG